MSGGGVMTDLRFICAWLNISIVYGVAQCFVGLLNILEAYCG